MNYDAFKARCKEKGTSPTGIVTKLGISKGNVTSWKNGGNPSIEVLVQIADILECSVDYLLDVEEIPERSSQMVLKKAIVNMISVPQRTLSLRSATQLTDSSLIAVADYLNAPIGYLCNDNEVIFNPVAPERESVNDDNIIYDIFEILDNCAGDATYSAMQVQISRIIMYNLKKKGFTQEQITDEHLLKEKIDYLYNGDNSRDTFRKYRFNFSDLTYLRKKLKVSFAFMFTGIK